MHSFTIFDTCFFSILTGHLISRGRFRENTVNAQTSWGSENLAVFFILDDGSAKYHVFWDGNYDKFIQCSQTDNKYLLCLRHIELKTCVNLAAEKRSFHWLFRTLSSVLCELCNSFLILEVIFLFVENTTEVLNCFCKCIKQSHSIYLRTM